MLFTNNKNLSKLQILLIMITLTTVIICSNNKGSNHHNQFRGYSIPQNTPIDSHQGCERTEPSRKHQYTLDSQHSSRLLQTLSPRNMQFLTYFQQDDDGTLDGYYLGVSISLLRSNYNIAAKYYSLIFKVDPINPDTTYNLGSTCGTLTYPPQIANGFKFVDFDMIIFTRIYTNDSTTTIAFAGACQTVRRPVFGVIYFNTKYINSILVGSTNKNYHRYAMVVIHEMGHIFGMSGNFYTNDYYGFSDFYKGPRTQDKYTNAEIIQNTNYMILPKVNQIVEAIHGCLGTGAKMAAGNGHWDSGVWPNQMMVPSLKTTYQRMSYLTLSVFEQSGWYYEVDKSQSWGIYDGYNQGCSWSNGSSSSYSPVQLGTCLNYQCTTPTQDCFVTSTGSRACLQASCVSSTQVRIVSGGSTYTCIEGQTSTFKIGSVTYNCPVVYQIFCDSQLCQNWCNKQGICVNGVCHIQNCRQYVDGCQFCTRQNGGAVQCNSCTLGFGLQLNKNTNTCINPTSCGILGCLSCIIDVNDNYKCLNCDSGSGYQLKSDGTCYAGCSTITFCSACAISGSNQICTQCIGDTYYDSSKSTTACVYKQCGTVISHCSTCIDDNLDGFLTCSKCLGDWQLDQTNNQCIVPTNCTKLISQCVQCDINLNNEQICTKCSGQLTVQPVSKKSCIATNCGSYIAHCQLCADVLTVDGVLQCTKCLGDWELDPNNNRNCRIPANCSLKIQYCDQCSINSTNEQVCSHCLGDRKVVNNQCVQKTCSETVADCQRCSAPDANGFLACLACYGDWELDLINNQCIAPTNCGLIIAQCQDCYINNLNEQICTKCQGQLSVEATNMKSCVAINCDSYISHCQQCADITIDGVLQCTKCQGDWELDLINNRNCRVPIDCSQKIQFCDQCTINSANQQVCSHCLGDRKVVDNLCVQKACNEAVVNCTSTDCTFDQTQGTISCTKCVGDLQIDLINNICYQPGCQISACNDYYLDENYFYVCTGCQGDKQPILNKCQFKACSTVVSNCQTCVDQDSNNVYQCIKCVSPWTVLNDRECYFDCSTVNANCLECSINAQNQLYCTKCEGDLVANRNLCQIPTDCFSIIDNCDKCQISGNNIDLQCTQCISPYILNPQNNRLCSLCSDIIPNCVQNSCQKNTQGEIICTQCQGDRQFRNGQCLFPLTCGETVSNCLNCNNNEQTDLVTCTKCQGDWNLIVDGNNQECILPSACSTIIDFCTSCFINSDDDLLRCSICEGDMTVNPTNNRQCIIPNCDDVISNCQAGYCIFNSSKLFECQKCLGDLLFINRVCSFPLSCSEIVNHCSTCVQNPDLISKNCTQCLGDWQLVNQRACSIPVCSNKVTDCTQCSIDQNNNFKCTKCDGDLIASNNQCVQPPCSNIINCQTCGLDLNNFQICTLCQTPYTKSLDQKSCYLECKDASQKCIECSVVSSTVTCTKCLKDWVLNQVSNTCEQPDTTNCNLYINGCSLCTFASDTLTCNQCLNGFIPNGNTCVLDLCKIDGCAENQCVLNTSGNPICQACLSGYILKNNLCYICPSNCNTCIARSSKGVTYTVCQSCASNYALYKGYCFKCPLNCVSCTGAQNRLSGIFTVCSQCVTGYYSYHGNCTQCPQNCDTCSLITTRKNKAGTVVCTVCTQGYKFDSNGNCVSLLGITDGTVYGPLNLQALQDDQQAEQSIDSEQNSDQQEYQYQSLNQEQTIDDQQNNPEEQNNDNSVKNVDNQEQNQQNQNEANENASPNQGHVINPLIMNQNQQNQNPSQQNSNSNNSNANDKSNINTNANTNDNANTNMNANTNANANTNSDANTNVNTNTNVNANNNVNANTIANPNTNINFNDGSNTNSNDVNVNANTIANTVVNTVANNNTNVSTNSNSNSNSNSNANANTNTNININANTNANTTANANVNANTNSNTNANTNANTTAYVNANANSNSNSNSNVNANTNANTSTSTNTSANNSSAKAASNANKGNSKL